MENIVEKIKNLQNEDLLFYKKLISFFETIGITTNDLANLSKLIKAFPEFVNTMNSVVSDQKLINEKYEEFIKGTEKKEVNANPLKAFNKEVTRLNPYGNRE